MVFGHVKRVEPAAVLDRLDDPEPLLVLFGGGDDAAVHMIECAEFHRMCKAFRASLRAERSRMLFNGSGVCTRPWVTQNC